jgi:hypothetical protein
VTAERTLLGIPPTCINVGATVSIDLFPQIPLCGPYRIRFPKDLHGVLALRDIQFGQQSFLACAGSVPVEVLETMPDLEGYVLHVGNILRLVVANVGMHAVLAVGSILASRLHVLMDRERGAKHSGPLRSLFETPPQQLFRPDRCPVPSDFYDPHLPKDPILDRMKLYAPPVAATPPAPAPEPKKPCSSRRPDTHECCVLREKHLEQHYDGLGQSWPEQATPTRRELEQREHERTHYLEDPDGWSAWESPTDES